MAGENEVVLGVQSYNAIKAENLRCKMFLENILGKAHLSTDHQQLVFNSEDVVNAFQFCFTESYKTRLSVLKRQATLCEMKREDKTNG